MNWLKRHIDSSSHSAPAEPPAWAPAEEPSRKFGLKSEAPADEFRAAEEFCENNPAWEPRFLPSALVERIQTEGCRTWELVAPNTAWPRLTGSIEVLQRKEGGPKVIRVVSDRTCRDVCLMSNIPIMGGMYGIQGKEGVYYEVQIVKMEGTVAIGTACQPYPEYRLPGWNRLSGGLHLDDFSKFFEDPNGGRPYDNRLHQIRPGDVIGCGYEFSTASLFYTYNGERLNTAFRGCYVPREKYDVYAAIGVGGPGANEIIVNFGGDDQDHLFRWKPGREWSWLIDGHVGRMAGGSGSTSDELPTYEEARYS